MELFFIIILLLLGIVFILLEIIVFPGITISGVLGGSLSFLGIYFAYAEHGSFVGHIVLGATVCVAIIATIFAFRYNSWQRVALEAKMDSRVEILKDKNIQVGDEGITTSKLSPMGNIKCGEYIIEAKSQVGYVPEDVLVQIVSIQGNVVVVEPVEV